MPEGQRVRTVATEETETGAKASRVAASEELLSKKSSETWWGASLDAAKHTESATIPLPPQIRLEQQRHEAARTAAEKAENLRKEMARRDEERRRAAQAVMNVSVACLRCGTRCNESPGEAFSFCTECGADLPLRTAFGMPANVSQQTAQTSRAMPAAPMQQGYHQNYQQGYQTTNIRQTVVTTAAPPRARVSPAVAGVLSFLLPGAGQLANGQTEKGILLLLGMYIAAFLIGLPAMGLPMLIARVVVAIDAYRIADRKRQGSAVRSSEWDIS